MKALYILDHREGGLVLYGHDLQDSLVETLVKEYQAQGKNAYSVDQAGMHGGPAEICEKCRRAGEKIASGTLVFVQPSYKPVDISFEGAIGVVSAEVEPSSKKLPNLIVPIQKLFSLVPILAALVLVSFGLFYFTQPEAVLNKDGQGLQPSLLPLTSETQVAQAFIDSPSPTPTSSPSPTATLQPTPSEEPSATEQAVTTDASSCMDALSITADFAGQTLCITGEVYRADLKEGVFSITFSKDWGYFYLLSYDRVWDDARPGVCIQATGKVVMSGTIPVIVFGYRNDLSLCP
jgi:hypothetical protein